MRILPSACVLLVALASWSDSQFLVEAKKSSRPSPSVPRGSGGRPGSSSRPTSRTGPVSGRKTFEEDDDEDEVDFRFPDEEEEEFDEDVYDEEEEEEVLRPTPSKSRPSRAASPPKKSRRPSASTPPPAAKRKPSSRNRPEPEYDEDYDYDRPQQRGGRPSRPSSSSSSRRGPPNSSRSGGRRPPPGRSGSVVPYGQQAAGTFTRGLAALRDSIPDPAAVRDAAVSTLSAARQTTSKLSSNIYRDIKGLTSSELEQVMLKATRPDDTAVKGKHAERLVGVTYQISGRYDIYDAVLRKLWGKMAEKDWRTTIKALYVLHRFAADGAPEHQAALKARLRELRRTRDPKRKDKYFNSKQLLAGDTTPENVKFRAFLSRYAHYVLLRAQCFGGMFDEISHDPLAGKPVPKKAIKPITATALRTEHLEAATMLLKAGVACSLKEGEECENTAIAAERVASDLIGLTTAVAVALNRALKGDDLKGADPAIIKRWCEFYSEELLPQTRSMVKKTSAKLDAYGLFLPSRMGASVSPEVLQKGLKAAESETSEESSEKEENVEAVDEATKEETAAPAVSEKAETEPTAESTEAPAEEDDAEEEEDQVEAPVEKDAKQDEYDDYEYDDEEYYDDEEA